MCEYQVWNGIDRDLACWKAMWFCVFSFRKSRVQEEKKREELENDFWYWLLFGLNLIYPPVSSTMLRTWHCEEINGASYLVSDFRLYCSDDRSIPIAVSVLGFVLYTLGIPFFFFYL